MAKMVVRWACEICGNHHQKKAKAIACEEQGLIGFEEGIEVGDFVEASIYASYGWHDKPDSMWTRELTSEEAAKTHHGKGRFARRFIVTHIGVPLRSDTYEGHRPRYSIYTPMTPWGTEQHCWTRSSGHIAIHKIEPTPELIAWKEASFAEWGGKASTLLL